MSVITPILDTLLHDVLGRRSAASALRALNETVTPVRLAGMLNPGQEDALLDVRRAAVPDLPKALARAGTQLPGSAPLPHSESLPGGVQSRLSPVAQIIANVLGRFPAPPSTLRILAPLIQGQASVPPALVATQLQASVNDSGLFYEAHLARWYRGALPLAQLAREPQMQLPGALRAPVPVPNALAANTAVAPGTAVVISTAAAIRTAAAATSLVDVFESTEPRSTAASSSGATYNAAGKTAVTALQQIVQQQGMPAPPPASAGTALEPRIDLTGSGRLASEQVTDSAAAARRAPEISESVHGIVRHQLELLSIPVLRWEGEVWAGIFMQLLIQVPESLSRDEREGGDKDNEGDAVESEVTLNLHSLGLLKVKLHLHGERLGMVLSTESPQCLQFLEAGRETLAERLRNCGFSTPGIQIKMLESTGAEDNGTDLAGST